MKNTVIILILMTFMTSGKAQDQVLQERDVVEKAKAKKYENGAEEGELKVQATLVKPQRKIAPVIEKVESESQNDRD